MQNLLLWSTIFASGMVKLDVNLWCTMFETCLLLWRS